KWSCAGSKDAINAMYDTHRDLARATGGRPLSPVTWTVLKSLVTPHPLGGCRMAEDASSGVVNHRGEVFGYRNLFVADGSVIPRALGLNPSKTIAACAELSPSTTPVCQPQPSSRLVKFLHQLRKHVLRGVLPQEHVKVPVVGHDVERVIVRPKRIEVL